MFSGNNHYHYSPLLITLFSTIEMHGKKPGLQVAEEIQYIETNNPRLLSGKTNKDLFVCKYSIQFCAKVLFRSFRWFVCRQVLFVFYVNKLPFSFQMEILNKYVFGATCFVLNAPSLKMVFLFNYHNMWEKFTAEIQFPVR